MVRFSFASLRVRLIFPVLMAILPLLGLILYSSLEDHRQSRSHAFQEALNLARNVSQTQENIIDDARQLLSTIAQVLKMHQFDKSSSSRILTDLLKKQTAYTDFLIAKPDGQVIISVPSSAQPLNIGSYSYYQRIIQMGDFVIGEYQMSSATGKAVLSLVYPIPDETGHLQAILLTGLDLTWLNQQLSKTKLLKEASLHVTDSNGTILLRYPNPDGFVGKSMPVASIFKTIVARGEGVQEAPDLNGIPSLYGFTSFGQPYGTVYVIVGIPKPLAFEEANRKMVRNLILLAVVALVAFAAAWFGGEVFIIRSVNRLLGITKLLGSGELTARVGTPYGKGEIAQLAYSFDQMAESLHKREAERQQAERELLLARDELELKVAERTTELQGAYKRLEGELADRKKAEERLQEANILLEKTFASLKEAVFVVNTATGLIINCNQAVESIFGYRRENVLGLTPEFLFVNQESYEKSLRMLFHSLDSNGVFHEEFAMRRKDGNIFPMEITVTEILDDLGNRTAVVSVMRDITERKRAEEALRESEEKYRFLVENANEAIFIIQDAVMRFPNFQTEKMTGYSAAELAHNPFVNLVHPEDRNMVLDCHSQRLKGEQSFNTYSFRIIDKSGEVIWVQLNMARINWDGRPATLNFLRDITLEKKLEVQLLQAQKMEAVGRLAGGVAHDFNNILTCILGYTQLMSQSLTPDNPLNEDVEEVHKAALSASSLTQQLLAFGRRQMIQPMILNFNEVANNMKKMMKSLIGENIKLIIHFDPELWRVKADPGQIEQMIINLAINAKDAMPEGGTLIIETANIDLGENFFTTHGLEGPAGSYVMLTVSDTGVGIDKDTQAHIFEPFFTTKEMGKGTGLGLSSVYGIVNQNGGLISVYSEPGEGTTFKIYFPKFAEDEAGEETMAAGPIKSLKGSETVLLVEDDDKVRGLAQSILRQYGYQVLVASNGEVAPMVCQQHQGPIHLMLTDVVMPGRSGTELTRCLLSLKPEMKVLYMSGYADDTIFPKGIIDTKIPFLQKPFTAESLVGKIRQVLDAG